MATQTYHGGCHCGAVRYAVDLDLDQGTLRCNCSLCRKTRAWFAFAPAEGFKLDKGDPLLANYRWTPEGKSEPNLTYHFCSNCGVRTHAEGTGPGGKATVAIQVATIEDADHGKLGRTVHFVDGLHDHFDKVPEEDTQAL